MAFFDFLKKNKAITDIQKEDTLFYNENYAKAIMLNYSKNGKPIGATKHYYPQYFYFRFGIKDPVDFHKKMIQDGYFAKADDMATIGSLNTDRLKKILKDNDLPTTGRKADLVKRICESVDINGLGIDTVFIPTSKGLKHLEEFGFVANLSKYNISLEEYEDQANRIKAKTTNPNDVIWGLLNKYFAIHSNEQNYGLARCDQLNMARVLIDESRFSDALFHLIIVLYYDTSGRGNGSRDLLDDVVVYSGVTSLVRRYNSYFEKNMISDCCQKFKIPGHYLTNKNFAKLVNMILDGVSVEEANCFIHENATMAAQKRSRKNDDDYEEWLSFLESGGTTTEWNKLKKG